MRRKIDRELAAEQSARGRWQKIASEMERQRCVAMMDLARSQSAAPMASRACCAGSLTTLSVGGCAAPRRLPSKERKREAAVMLPPKK
jgi:hypothetical protein